MTPSVLRWANYLTAKIEEQKKYHAIYEKRYNNEFVLPFLQREYAEVYGTSLATGPFFLGPTDIKPPKSGAAAIGVDALVERLSVSGFDAGDEPISELLNNAWLENDLDVMHREAHREAFIKGRSFAVVDRDPHGRAVVGIESAEQMAVHRTPGPPYSIDAAAKIWQDEWTGEPKMLLRLPGQRITLSRAKNGTTVDEDGVQSIWEVDAVQEDGWAPLEVPVVEFANKPRLLKEPVSDIEPIESLVDVLDLVEGLMVFAGHFGAVPIRFGTGFEVPRDPTDPSKPVMGPDGKPQIGFRPRADHFWYAADKDATFGQLTPAGLEGFVVWSNHVASKIRAITSVASTYYSGVDLKSHMSAELLKTDEAPMVRRINSIGPQGGLNQAWRRMARHILAIEAPTFRAAVRPTWENPETRIESMDADTVTKLVAAGMDFNSAVTKIMGWNPTEFTQAVAASTPVSPVDPDIERLSREFLADPTADS